MNSSETRRLTSNDIGKNVSENTSSQKDKGQCFFNSCMYCLSLCIIILISGLFIAFIFIIYDIKEEKELIDNKNITLINNWVNNSEVVICNVENPCYVMCKEYPHSILLIKVIFDECGERTRVFITCIFYLKNTNDPGTFRVFTYCAAFAFLVGALPDAVANIIPRVLYYFITM